MPPLVLLPVTKVIILRSDTCGGVFVDPSSEAPKRAGIDRWCPVGGGPCGKASTDGEAVGARAGDVFDEHVLRRHAVVPRALVPDAYHTMIAIVGLSIVIAMISSVAGMFGEAWLRGRQESSGAHRCACAVRRARRS